MHGSVRVLEIYCASPGNWPSPVPQMGDSSGMGLRWGVHRLVCGTCYVGKRYRCDYSGLLRWLSHRQQYDEGGPGKSSCTGRYRTTTTPCASCRNSAPSTGSRARITALLVSLVPNHRARSCADFRCFRQRPHCTSNLYHSAACTGTSTRTANAADAFRTSGAAIRAPSSQKRAATGASLYLQYSHGGCRGRVVVRAE